MSRIIHIKLTIMALLWAGGFISAKSIAADAGPFTICFLRFLIASILVGGIVYHKRVKVAWDMRLILLAVGAAFIGVFCYNYFFLKGIQHVDAGRGSVIVSTVPIIVALASAFMFQEQLTVNKFIGISASLLGAWVVITKGELIQFLQVGMGKGELLMMGCVFSAAGFSMMSKAMLHRLQPLHLMVCVSTLGTAFVAGPAWLELQGAPLTFGSEKFVLNLLYLAIGPSVVALMFYYDAIKSVGAARASQYMNLMPVFSVLLAMVFLGEQLTGSLIVGAGLVTTGLFLTNTGGAA